MGTRGNDSVVVPRNFRLLEELERGEKDKNTDSFLSYGLDDGGDIEMKDWTATILGPPNTAHENRIYCLTLFCGDKYPEEPPQVRFRTRVKLTFVNDQTGIVDPRHFPYLKNWTRNESIEKLLREIRSEMASHPNKKLAQPGEETTFF